MNKILMGLVAISLAACAAEPKEDILKLKDYKVSITDGDTIRAGDHRLRMQYIDAPEIKQKCKHLDGKIWDCGQKSKEFLSNLVNQDISQVTCKIVGKDKYKRKLAICYKGKLDINKEMVRQGYAVAYVKYGSPYIEDQKEAMGKLRGIWNGTFIEPEFYRKLNKVILKDDKVKLEL